MQQFNDLKNLILSAEDDAKKFFEKGNAAAGKRLRAHMQNAKILAQGVRMDVSQKKKEQS